MLEDIAYVEQSLASGTTFRQFQQARWKALEKNKELRSKAVRFLSKFLETEKELLKYLFGLRKISAFRDGGDIFTCPACGNGELRRKRHCFVCYGRGRFHVPALHSTLGVQVRNALRQAGFGEEAWPIWSLDDYYLVLVEAAVIGETQLQEQPPKLMTVSLLNESTVTFDSISDIVAKMYYKPNR